jgi:antitoxin component HigA of HigAB toxin-antitoxin module
MRTLPRYNAKAMKPKKWFAPEDQPAGLDPVRLLDKLMKKHKLRPVDLAAELGISQSLLSDIRAYRRGLSKEVIRKLAARFEVGQESFSSPYNLSALRAGRPQNASSPPQKKGPRDTATLELLQRRTGMPTIATLKDGRSVTIWNIMPHYFGGAEYAFITTNVKPTIKGQNADIFYTSAIAELIDPATGNKLAAPTV